MELGELAQSTLNRHSTLDTQEQDLATGSGCIAEAYKLETRNHQLRFVRTYHTGLALLCGQYLIAGPQVSPLKLSSTIGVSFLTFTIAAFSAHSERSDLSFTRQLLFSISRLVLLFLEAIAYADIQKPNLKVQIIITITIISNLFNLVAVFLSKCFYRPRHYQRYKDWSEISHCSQTVHMVGIAAVAWSCQIAPLHTRTLYFILVFGCFTSNILQVFIYHPQVLNLTLRELINSQPFLKILLFINLILLLVYLDENFLWLEQAVEKIGVK